MSEEKRFNGVFVTVRIENLEVEGRVFPQRKEKHMDSDFTLEEARAAGKKLLPTHRLDIFTKDGQFVRSFSRLS